MTSCLSKWLELSRPQTWGEGELLQPGTATSARTNFTLHTQTQKKQKPAVMVVVMVVAGIVGVAVVIVLMVIVVAAAAT